jgi:hypothetical protein
MRGRQTQLDGRQFSANPINRKTTRLDTTLPAVFDPSTEPNKVLATAKALVFKKFSWTKSQPLFDALRLAQLLVLFGKEDEALEVCRTLGRLEFTGNFNLWSPVEKALALQSRLLRKEGNTMEAEACLKRVRDVGFVDDRLEGKLLDRNGDIPDAIRDGDKKTERLARLIYGSELVFIIELGGSPVRPVDGLEKDLEANKAALRTLVGAK